MRADELDISRSGYSDKWRRSLGNFEKPKMLETYKIATESYEDIEDVCIWF